MTYTVVHTTTYDYAGTVSMSLHTLRLAPRQLLHQECHEHQFQITPKPVLMRPHVDYYGNSVMFATVEGAHQRLVVTSSSRVTVSRIRLPPPAETPRWETVRESCRGEQIGPALEASEFLHDSPLVQSGEEFAVYARPSFTPARPVLEAVMDLTRRIHTEFIFDPKATTIATPLADVLRLRRGVCQDFAQLQIACLRSLGLPARYVSGYLETDPPPGQVRLAGADASHAWASFYCPGLGWIDVDPTNNILAGTRHITVGWGRDFSDVSPVRGVILGSGDHTLRVAVDVVPVAAPAAPVERE